MAQQIEGITPPAPKKPLLKSLMICVMGLVLMAAAFLFLEYRSGQIRSIPGVFSSQPENSTDRTVVYQDHIQPVIQQYHQENLKAINRAISELEGYFNEYEEGIDDFVDDMTGMRSRMEMLGRQFQDWWDEAWNGVAGNRVAQSVQESFERHVYSENRIRQDVSMAIDTLAHALNSNQNLMLSRIQDVVRETEPGIDPGQFVMSSYDQALRHTWNSSFEGMGEKTFINLAQSLTIDILGSWSVIWQFIPEPYRTPVALVLALVVDYWNSKRMANNLKAECRDMVRHTRDAVLHDIEKGIVPRMKLEMENLYQANLETTENLLAGNQLDRFRLMLGRIFQM